jgi:HPt (histidine-containing phosphotransfer) domain-containing protein
VEIDPDLEFLLPTFLENRRADIGTIRHALESSAYRAIHRIGHNLRGDSGALGFDELTAVGSAIERAAEQQDDARITAEAERLASYLELVDIVPRE